MSSIQWKPVVGAEKFYAVSSSGLVKRIARARGATPGRILTTKPDKYGYPVVEIRKDGKRWRVYVHTLVATAFIRSLNADEEVNHKDGNKLNTNLDNLEIGTRKHNVEHAWDTGLNWSHGEKSHFAKLSDQQAAEIREMNLPDFKSCRPVAERFGVNVCTIWRITRGETFGRVKK